MAKMDIREEEKSEDSDCEDQEKLKERKKRFYLEVD